jgi:hypothetical protein
MERKGFAAAINCIDGRVQHPVAKWMKDHFAVEYVDMITEPGADRVMTLGPPGAIDAIKQKVLRSVRGHHSNVVAVVGHHDCLANPIPRREHLNYLKQSVERIVSWGLSVRVVGLWVNERWEVELIIDTEWKGSVH